MKDVARKVRRMTARPHRMAFTGLTDSRAGNLRIRPPEKDRDVLDRVEAIFRAKLRRRICGAAEMLRVRHGVPRA